MNQPSGQDKLQANEQPERQSRTQLYSKSAFASALICFWAVCALAGATRFGQLAPDDFPVRTWTATAITDFLSNQTGRVQFVFLGSSLMLTPLQCADAAFTGKTIDSPYHHRCELFEHQWFETTHDRIKTFNFAIPGEMPTDSYLIVRDLLQGEKQPKVIVVGVGPRDFMDNLLPSPAATDPFEQLSRLHEEHSNDYRPELWSRLNYLLSRACPVYGKKNDLACQSHRYLLSALAPFLPRIEGNASLRFRNEVLPTYRSFEVAKNLCLIAPLKPGERASFVDNAAEYRARYKKLDLHTFNLQFKYLDRSLALANSRGIQTVLMAMPITGENRQLISEDAWNMYCTRLRMLARHRNAIFIDAQVCANFKRTDFGDTVHLNQPGGLKLVDLVCSRLESDDVIHVALQRETRYFSADRSALAQHGRGLHL